MIRELISWFVAFTVGAGSVYYLMSDDADYETIRAAWNGGYQLGQDEAFKTNPPSDRLEYVCAALWFNKEVAFKK